MAENNNNNNNNNRTGNNNQPRNNQPRNNQPRNNQPRNNQPRNNQPRNNQPRNNQPRNNQPRNNQPRDNQPRDKQHTNNTQKYNIDINNLKDSMRNLQETMRNEMSLAIGEYETFGNQVVEKYRAFSDEKDKEIEEIENSDISIALNGNQKELSLIEKYAIKKYWIDGLETEKGKQRKAAEEIIDEARKQLSKKFKDNIDNARQSIEEKLTPIDDELKEKKAELEKVKEPLQQFRDAIDEYKVKKMEGSPVYTLVEKEIKTISDRCEQLNNEINELEANQNALQEQLDLFDKQFGNFDFESEYISEEIIKALYGKGVDTDLYVKAFTEAYKKGEEEQAQNPPGQNPAQQSGQNPAQRPGQNPAQNPAQQSGQNPAQRPGQNPAQNPAQQSGQNPAQQPRQNPAQQPGQGNGQQLNNAEDNYIMKYIARSDEYEIIDLKTGKAVEGAKRENIDKYIDEEKLSKQQLVQKLINRLGIKVTEENFEKIDPRIALAWMSFDNKYKTSEVNKYIQSIINPKEVKNVEYDLRGLYSNKKMSKGDKSEILKCANDAKKNRIADVKKGIIENAIERLENITKGFRNKGVRSLNSVAENTLTPTVKKNTFNKETKVTSEYNILSQEISQAGESKLNDILKEARDALKAGIISATEYSGLIYNASVRRNTLMSGENPDPKGPAQNQTPSQENYDYNDK